MKEYLHLFTDVKEALPEKDGKYATINTHGQFKVQSWNGRRTKLYGYWHSVTHWLDLSKLTTKERAVDLVAKCVMFPTQSEEFIKEL